MSESNESLKYAIEALMEQFIVKREDNPDLFSDIKKYEKEIRMYMIRNFGYSFKLGSETAKVEKIPYKSRDWMGVEIFKSETDYVFLMALYAILETKSLEDGFLLSVIIDDVKLFLLDIYEVNWKERHQRESFVRAMQFAQNMQLIKVRDGQLSDFEKSEAVDVLYESTPLVRYQSRSFSKRLEDINGIEGMLRDGLDEENVLHTLFRKLYVDPVVFFSELSEEEINYLDDRKNFAYLKAQLETYTFFELERAYQCIYLVHDERKRKLHQHPSFKNDSFIVTQIAYMLTQKLRNMGEKPFGLIQLKNSEFEVLLKDTIGHFELGWTSKMRSETFERFKNMVMEYLIGWKLAEYHDTTMEMTFYPAFIRTIGEYEADFRDYIETSKIEGVK